MLTSEIDSYDPDWPIMFEAEAKQIASIFGSRGLSIHHVGSTAVPGLAAKPEIDILCVVSDAACLESWTKSLSSLNYRRGGDLSPGHYFFKRNKDGVRTHKIHVCIEGHGSIRRMVGFRDHLRNNPVDRQKYQDLKFELSQTNRDGIQEYLSKKAPFIDAMIAGICK
nr:GrpB family protein [Agrobacterium sp. rho-8.1]